MNKIYLKIGKHKIRLNKSDLEYGFGDTPILNLLFDMRIVVKGKGVDGISVPFVCKDENAFYINKNLDKVVKNDDRRK